MVESKKETYLYMGISLDKFSNDPTDKISMIDFYNSFNHQIYCHYSTSFKNKERFTFEKLGDNFTFEEWRTGHDIIIPITKEKFDIMKQINILNHKSLKKFLRSFSFEEYII
jgi:hypothetical protein